MPAIALTTRGQYGITYYEEAEGWRETWAPDASQFARTCRVMWKDRYKFILDMLGWTSNVVDQNTGRMQRFLPEAHPVVTWAYATDCDLKAYKGVPSQDATGVMMIEERSADGSLAEPGTATGTGWAIYDVKYSAPVHAIKSDTEIQSELERFVVRDEKLTVENLRLPGQSFQWGSLGDTGLPAGTAIPAGIADKVIPEAATMGFPLKTLHYTWLQVPVYPETKIDAAIGKVNAAAFDTSFGNYPAETLLFDSVEKTRVRHATSTYYWKIVYQFRYRPKGWNKIWSRVGGDFFKVVRKADTSKGVYETADFDSLFKLN